MAVDSEVSRRTLLKGTAALGAGLALAPAMNAARRVRSRGSTSSVHQRSEGGRPNLVVFLVDDLDDVVSPYWDAMPEARGLFVDQGRRFSNSFAPSPVCCPARGVILTGMGPHNDGVISGTPPDGGYETFAKNGSETRTVSVRLQQAGYTTAFIGKYLNGYEKDPKLVPAGWDEKIYPASMCVRYMGDQPRLNASRIFNPGTTVMRRTSRRTSLRTAPSYMRISRWVERRRCISRRRVSQESR